MNNYKLQIQYNGSLLTEAWKSLEEFILDLGLREFPQIKFQWAWAQNHSKIIYEPEIRAHTKITISESQQTSQIAESDPHIPQILEIPETGYKTIDMSEGIKEWIKSISEEQQAITTDQSDFKKLKALPEMRNTFIEI